MRKANLPHLSRSLPPETFTRLKAIYQLALKGYFGHVRVNLIQLKKVSKLFIFIQL